MIDTILPNKVKVYLMDPNSLSIEEPYFIISSSETDEKITLISPGKNGTEFNKTMGYSHTFPGVLIYHCLYGQGILIIQKNDENGQAKDVRVMALRRGVEVEVPAGYGHTVVNTGRTFLAVLDRAPNEEKFKDFETFKSKHGLVYYIVDKKGDISFEKNPSYSYYPQITNF